jgi:glucose/arabinose dehydrogenase
MAAVPKCVLWALISMVSIGCTSSTPGPEAQFDHPKSTVPSPGTAISPSEPTPHGAPTLHKLRRGKLRLVRIAKIPQAVALASRPGDETLYVGTRDGRILALRDGVMQRKPILDISKRVSTEGEQGLFSLSFSPHDDRLYISYTDRDSQGWVQSYVLANGVINVSSLENVLRLKQPSIRHNGGNIVFGPDGLLWVGFGDGSLGNDPMDKAQTLTTFHGKLLRINPTPDGARPYVVPNSNPFVGRPGARPEIYAYGLRNPWRFSFDLQTGDLWIGDVGQYIIEEIDYLPSGARAGANFGWSRLEGTLTFSGDPPKRVVDPIAEYNHDDGRCAVIGGNVYRGQSIADLFGAYLYGDLCDGQVRALVQKRGRVVSERADLGLQLPGLVSFAQLPNGEVLLISLTEGVFRIEEA